MRRLRITHLVVTPVLVWDDGEQLEPGPQAAQILVPLHHAAELPDRLRADLARLEVQAGDALPE